MNNNNNNIEQHFQSSSEQRTRKISHDVHVKFDFQTSCEQHICVPHTNAPYFRFSVSLSCWFIGLGVCSRHCWTRVLNDNYCFSRRLLNWINIWRYVIGQMLVTINVISYRKTSPIRCFKSIFLRRTIDDSCKQRKKEKKYRIPSATKKQTRFYLDNTDKQKMNIVRWHWFISNICSCRVTCCCCCSTMTLMFSNSLIKARGDKHRDRQRERER
jgi:hypothetical protein